jgi:hypothetical protein
MQQQKKRDIEAEGRKRNWRQSATCGVQRE